ncbi:O-methyltransferas-like protein family 3 [Delitschia confertaspora ATCC 74209]|uniref:O-methyltransferas-like protein family 3 n=1 Tax=Delitschia confertaspora ATCC 74209 TaxID=1513339 RepID=A0A9P4JN41_9PLEO|nr:O-methyltransferas-like protein family 3 [Delitschia confertaspora ATCC 74209]
MTHSRFRYPEKVSEISEICSSRLNSLLTMSQHPSHETDPRWTAVDNYSFSHLRRPSSTTLSSADLSYALTNSAQNGLPDIAVSPSQGKYLMLQAKLVKAKNILEVGTLGGYSTIWLANSSPDVQVVSVEVNSHHAGVARANLSHAGVGERVEIKLGPGVEVLPQLAEEVKQGKRGKFQMVFIDADKENNWNYVDVAVGMTEQGGCIIVDNVVRKGLLADPNTTDPRVWGAKTVVENIGKDERLDGVVMQTVGEKNYDGFLIAVVK